MVTSKRIFTNTGWQWLEKAATVPLRLAALALISNYLGERGFGQYSFILAFTLFFTFFTDFGLDDTIIKFLSKNEDELKRVLGHLVKIKTLLSAGAGAVAFVLMALLGYGPNVLIGMAMASIAILFFALGSVGVIYFRLRLKMEYSAVANITGALAFLVLVLVTISTSGGILHFVLAYSASMLIRFLVTAYLLSKNVKLAIRGFDWPLWKGITINAVPWGVAFLLSNIYGRVDVVILSGLATFSSVGIYTAAYNFVNVGVMIPVALIYSIFPLMTKSWQNNPQALKRLFERTFEYLLLMAGPITVAIWILAPKLMRVFGPGFQRGAPALRWLAPALGLMFVSVLAAFTLVAIEKQKITPITSLVGMVVNVSLNFILIPKYGFIAPAFVTLVTEVVVLTPVLWIIASNIRPGASLRAFIRIIFVTSLCAVVLALTTTWNLPAQILFLFPIYVISVLATGGIIFDTTAWGETPTISEEAPTVGHSRDVTEKLVSEPVAGGGVGGDEKR